MEPILTDGALGTEYQRLGLPAGMCPDLWNLDAPERVVEVTRSYIEAGSRAVLTTTFRANRTALELFGREPDVTAINREAVRLCREAAGGRDVLVIGSVGPCGEAVEGVFAEQCEALAEGGADFIVFETLSDVTEALAALRAALRTGLPVIVSFAFDTRVAGYPTSTGLAPEAAAAAVTDAGAWAVGGNCGIGFAEQAELCRRLKAATNLPIWIKPSAGLPEIVDGRAVYRSGPEDFAVQVPRYIAAGASFVGGCCGTTPEFIRAASAALRQM